MKKLLPYIFLFLLRITAVYPTALTLRYLSYCSYLNQRIYCYSGLDNNKHTLTDMAALYVHNTSRISTSTLSNLWETVNPNNQLGNEGRSDAQVVTSPDRKIMYVQGGYDPESRPSFNSFIAFNADTNSWIRYDDYQHYNIQNGLIRYAASSYVPSINKIVYFGGLTQINSTINVTVDDTEIAAIPGSTEPYLPFGFNNLTAFDPNTRTWTTISNATNQNKDEFFYTILSVLVPKSNTNYYIGGSTISRANNSETFWLPFSEISSVRFPEYTWETHTCTGNIPSRRDKHTLTLLPDEKTVLIYGGTYNYETAISDHCYLLNLEKKEWKDCGLMLPAGVVGARWSHSAVLVENRLFILFGRPTQTSTLNDMIVLDVSNPDKIEHIAEYAYGEIPIEPTPSVPDNKSGGGLGTGAIVGIVVGILALLIIIFGVLFFIRKKKADKKNESQEDFPVDWNAIDQVFSHGQQGNNNIPKMNVNTAVPHMGESEISHSPISSGPPPYHLAVPNNTTESPKITIITAKKALSKSAVIRNRAERRLRGALQYIYPQTQIRGYDILIFAKPPVILSPWTDIINAMEVSMTTLQNKINKNKNKRYKQ
ncbi:hypothetical protein BDB01DRAFT_836321 [Pilobolus umbonatus]|nr:hypothetical protein BDB01DRAFT_836321 [Pilobolus umbonatus]